VVGSSTEARLEVNIAAALASIVQVALVVLEACLEAFSVEDRYVTTTAYTWAHLTNML
jgi:hypothetical protein